MSVTALLTVIAAHPRSRGENRRPLVLPERRLGSSPLTRGKRSCVPTSAREPRLIPAHAGKTLYCWRGNGGRWAHPRSRGENVFAALMIVLIWGSSPLTRGKPRGRGQAHRPGGLIPAHAGKTALPGGRPCGRRAHPRSRGENYASLSWRSTARGSSPLTRGKREGLEGIPELVGLIPAHAGKTRAGRYVLESGSGSSPLTRGKPWTIWRGAGCCGLIPAHAGKTFVSGTGLGGLRAHPRSRGENRRALTACHGYLGSSPLTRGKHSDGRDHERVGGLIPAHAGKTWWRGEGRRGEGAHPRSRGENREVCLSE